MKSCFWGFLVAMVVIGCETTDVGTGDGDGNVTIIVQQCAEDTRAILPGIEDGGTQAPNVIETCDDHLPCTVDIQCMPCSQVPEEFRFVKATCTPDEKLSPFCYANSDPMEGRLLYTGCVHFIADPTPPGVSNACFPVAYLDDTETPRAGVCNPFGICVENPAP